MRSFRVVFIVLLVSLSLSLLLWGYRSAPAVPADLGLGRGFSGDLLLPRAEIETALSQARTAMLAYHQTGLRLKVGSDVAALLAFIATSAVTLILGWWGLALGIPITCRRRQACRSGRLAGSAFWPPSRP